MPNPGSCMVCDTLSPQELVELDMTLADPLRWPKTVWGLFPPPEVTPDGMLPASYRRFGALEMGREWLMANGYDIKRPQLRKHFSNHVPIIHVSVDELVQRGLIKVDTRHKVGEMAIDPMNFVKFYGIGIDLGLTGLRLLQQRLDGMIARGEEIDLKLVKQIVDTGVKLATSQAQLRTRGNAFSEDEDENEGFRGGEEDVSPRFGSYRVRQIEGEARPVFDEGPTDRKRYNQRAAQEGMPPLGGQ